MFASGPVLRFFVVVLALLQVAGAPATALADALLSRAAAAGSIAHVEDATREQCAPSHDADCGLCRALAVLGHGSAPGGNGVPLAQGPATPAPAGASDRDRFPSQPLPRAPPAAPPAAA